jgi:hypothetical protein
VALFVLGEGNMRADRYPGISQVDVVPLLAEQYLGVVERVGLTPYR